MGTKELWGLLLVGLSGASQATLIDRGGGMIYDDVLDITWLQDANMGAGSAFDDGSDTTDGRMTWNSAVAWADDLSFGGFDDWRLASMDVNGDHMATGALGNGIVDCRTASELECRDNELGYMYYQNLVTLSDPGLFTNLQGSHWSGTEFAPNPDFAWVFSFFLDFQGILPEENRSGAWAVRSGDVLAAVPEPGMLALLGLGLAGFGVSRTRRAVRT